jgi:RNA polymerase sigma factor (TIGR02999 family)
MAIHHKSPMSDVTQILGAIDAGDAHAAEQLLPLVYDELRKLAAAKMANELPGQTLNATALVHEAYLHLVGNQQFENRSHFFAAAAEAMRRILIDRARQRKALKRGGDRQRVDLDKIDVAAEQTPAEFLDLDDALAKLEATDKLKAELVKLRFFAGMTNEQAAATLGISPSTADNYWAYARAWLRLEIETSRKN